MDQNLPSLECPELPENGQTVFRKSDVLRTFCFSLHYCKRITVTQLLVATYEALAFRAGEVWLVRVMLLVWEASAPLLMFFLV